jgi:hypothetical protein
MDLKIICIYYGISGMVGMAYALYMVNGDTSRAAQEPGRTKVATKGTQTGTDADGQGPEITNGR